MKETLNELSVKLGIPPEEILRVYRTYWKFIRTTIESLPLKEDLDEEAFGRLKTNFNISGLGKLHCTYSRYKTVKLRNKRFENAEHKKSKTDSQLCPHHKGDL